MSRPFAILGVLIALFVAPTQSVAFERVQDGGEFIEAVAGKDLVITRPFFLRSAISLNVSPPWWRTQPGVSLRRNISSESLTVSIRSIEKKYRTPLGNTISCVQRDPALWPGAASVKR